MSGRTGICALVVGLAALLLTSCSTSDGVRSTKNESLYERVMRTGKIRAAYVLSPPFCSKDPNTGKISGMSIEAIELIAKKLGLTVEISEEVGWGTALEGIQTGRYDMMATPFWTNPDRAKIAGFSKPLFFSPVFAYIKRGDDRFKGHLEKVNSPDVKIVTIDGETAQVIANADFPKAKRLSLTQMTDYAQLLLSVATAKADIAFVEPITAGLFMQNNPNAIEILDADHPLRIYPNCWMFARGEYEFKAMLDTVLDEVINSGAMDRMLNKCHLAPNMVLRVALPYQVPGENKGNSTLAQSEQRVSR